MALDQVLLVSDELPPLVPLPVVWRVLIVVVWVSVATPQSNDRVLLFADYDREGRLSREQRILVIFDRFARDGGNRGICFFIFHLS